MRLGCRDWLDAPRQGWLPTAVSLAGTEAAAGRFAGADRAMKEPPMKRPMLSLAAAFFALTAIVSTVTACPGTGEGEGEGEGE